MCSNSPLATRHSQLATRYNSAFTLIELSLVLVIIGLVVGGVLVGRDLIKAAEVRSAISQLTQMETSYRTFKLKYNCIVGDCPNATELFGANYYNYNVGCTYTNGAGNGNGNGFIDGGGGGWYCESLNAAASLKVTQMLPQSFFNTDDREYFKWVNGASGYLYNDDVYQPAGMPFLHENTVTFFMSYPSWPTGGVISPVMARVIDSKIDDGIAEKGKFSGLKAATSTTPSTLIPTSCSNGAIYNNNEDFTCRAIYYFK